MKKTTTHSKNSLFLMEMILVLLFLSLSGAACVRIFAAARQNHIQTQEWLHIQSLTTTVGEAMEGTSATTDDFLRYLPDGTVHDSTISWYYDNSWNSCDSSDASYRMSLSLTSSATQKQGTLVFSRLYGAKKDLYSIDLAFPVILSPGKEAQS